MSAPLSADDVHFIHDVARRRFAGDVAATTDEDAVAAAVAASAEGSPFVRAATLVAVLLQRAAFSVAPLQTALLVLHCALSLEGFSLVAPQGVLAGMIRSLADGGAASDVARWLEDRAVPSASS